MSARGSGPLTPLGTVVSLTYDALGFVGYIDNIVGDTSSGIGRLTGSPPPPEIVSTINTRLEALEKAGEEEEDNQSSVSDTISSTASRPDSSSVSSADS